MNKSTPTRANVVVLKQILNLIPRGCDRRRWDIEVFFKQVKQSLKLGSFLGHSANAVRWQIYTALLVDVLLRFMAHLSDWSHGFTRLFAVTRSALWERLDLLALLKSYGTGISSSRHLRHFSSNPARNPVMR